MIKNIKQKKKGFVLLFAVLVSVLVLAVGASIISIALKQILLSGAGRESQYAFYAANTGIECALYWDLEDEGAFVNDSDITDETALTTSGNTCAGIDISSQIDSNDPETTPTSAIHEFRIDLDGRDLEFDNNEQVTYCADVIVTKQLVNTNGFDRVATQIISRGYNTCDANNPRRIERGLELNY